MLKSSSQRPGSHKTKQSNKKKNTKKYWTWRKIQNGKKLYQIAKSKTHS